MDHPVIILERPDIGDAPISILEINLSVGIKNNPFVSYFYKKKEVVRFFDPAYEANA